MQRSKSATTIVVSADFGHRKRISPSAPATLSGRLNGVHYFFAFYIVFFEYMFYNYICKEVTVLTQIQNKNALHSDITESAAKLFIMKHKLCA